MKKIFNKTNKKQFTVCKKIKVVLTDVDGVLTDGGRYYSEKGEIFKKFHVRDGMGVNLLLRNNIKTIIITKEKSKIVRKWSKDMNISGLLMNIQHKELTLAKICKKFKVTNNEIAFIGDDVNDLKLFKKVGFSATPNDGIEQAKQIVDYVCKTNGGEGAFRELSDIILYSKFGKKYLNIKIY
jgi:YrbI family 3-deoxy-D-manno-octulosonate 8-phosphate phosphatase